LHLFLRGFSSKAAEKLVALSSRVVGAFAPPVALSRSNLLPTEGLAYICGVDVLAAHGKAATLAHQTCIGPLFAKFCGLLQPLSIHVE